MSVVVCKVYRDKIEMASDSIAVKGWSKLPNSQNKIIKMMKWDDMVIGGCGGSEELSLMFHYMKTHTIEVMDEKNILNFVIEFKKWKQDITGDKTLNNPYIIAYQGKAFAIEGMLVFPIDDYYAIGAGAEFAMGALFMGANPREAVDAACNLCVSVSGPVVVETIPR